MNREEFDIAIAFIEEMMANATKLSSPEYQGTARTYLMIFDSINANLQALTLAVMLVASLLHDSDWQLTRSRGITGTG